MKKLHFVALAATFLPLSVFANCYERFYDGAHLKANPNQELRVISMDTDYNYRQEPQTSYTTYKMQINSIVAGKPAVLEISGQCESELSDLEKGKKTLCTVNTTPNQKIEIQKLEGEFELHITLPPALPLSNKTMGAKANASLKDFDRVFRLKKNEKFGFEQCRDVIYKPNTVTTTRLWNEALLFSIRNDMARPTVTARNLFHFSALMWDVFTAFEKDKAGYYNKSKFAGLAKMKSQEEIEKARSEALSYAAYTFLKERFNKAPGNQKDSYPKGEGDSGDGKKDLIIDEALDTIMAKLGLTLQAKSEASTFGVSTATTLLKKLKSDGSREEQNYSPEPGYVLNNKAPALDVMQSGLMSPIVYGPDADKDGMPIKHAGVDITSQININYWTPLFIPGSLDQNGNELDSAQVPLTLFWGKLPTFSNLSEFKSTDKVGVYFDRHVDFEKFMPKFETNPDAVINYNLKVIEYSALMNPIDLEKEKLDFDGDGQFDKNPGAMLIDISPKARGNNSLGKNDGHGYEVNPVTGKPYQSEMVKQADFYRSLAEFWADGPKSETPPGHWNVIANTVVDRMIALKIPLKWGGSQTVLSREEYELKLYMALNGALYDASIVGWGLKGHYQTNRPILVIRMLAKMAENDEAFAKKLEAMSPYFKMVTYTKKDDSETPLKDGKQVVLRKLAIWAWRGPSYFGEIPNNRDYSFNYRNAVSTKEHEFYSENEIGGVGWITAENWLPYQSQTFVTPPFPGFISGHSTFSRAAAEVLTHVTGTKFFPGGLGTYKAPKLVFEKDLEQPFEFQWATYYDAADQSGISRIFGGIHAPYDDEPGRIIGSEIGKKAFERAKDLFK